MFNVYGTTIYTEVYFYVPPNKILIYYFNLYEDFILIVYNIESSVSNVGVCLKGFC